MKPTYSQWEEAVAEQIAQSLEVSLSDAQGIMEGQVFAVQQSWGKGLDATQTAAKVIAESTPAS